MKKLMLFVTVLCLCVGALAPTADASALRPSREASGILLSYDATQTPPMFLLQVDGKDIEGVAFEYCEFFGEKDLKMTADDFLNRYRGRVVTLSLWDDSGEVFKCVIGSPRSTN